MPSALLRMVLAHGGDADARNPHTGATPLMQALLSPDARQYEVLLEAGADPDLADRNGDTALHVAARTNAGGAILRLLEQGADPEAKNSGGATFQDYYFGFRSEALNDRARRTPPDRGLAQGASRAAVGQGRGEVLGSVDICRAGRADGGGGCRSGCRTHSTPALPARARKSPAFPGTSAGHGRTSSERICTRRACPPRSGRGRTSTARRRHGAAGAAGSALFADDDGRWYLY